MIFLNKFTNYDFDIRTAFAIHKLFKELESSCQFGISRERSLLEKYNGVVEPNGRINFVHGKDDESIKAGIENMHKYKEEIDELHAMEITEEFTPITLSYEAFGDQKVTPSDIASLDDFVIFE